MTPSVSAPTEEQRAAIEARSGDAFLEAGAGTGKTRTLVELYSAAVREDGVGIDRILAFTFTDRAASELRGRIRRELLARSREAASADPVRAAELARAARDTERGFVTTIHGFCHRVLSTHPGAAGVDPRFRVLDEVESDRLAARAVALATEELIAAGDETVAELAAGFRPGRLGELIRSAYARMRSQGAAEPRLPDPGEPVRSLRREDERPLSAAEARAAGLAVAALQRLLDRYGSLYTALKDERSGLDFEDLQLRSLELLRREGPVRDAWRGRFEHLLVDEFQDTNRVQLGLIEALRGPGTRLLTVGDEFQSIYRFRHADLRVFRERRASARTGGRTTTLELRGNFRSRPEIVATLNLIGDALLDDFRPLVASREASGAPAVGGPEVELLLTASSAAEMGGRRNGGWSAEGVELEPPESERNPVWVAEARALAERLRKLAAAGVPRGEMVVLLRAFTHVDAFEEALERAGLDPYVVGGRGYWSSQQVEDALRLLRTIANPLDDEALFGALSSPACGLSADALWLLRDAAGPGRHVWRTLADAFGPGGGDREPPPEPDHTPEVPDPLAEIGAEDAARLRRFCADLAALRAEAPILPLDALTERALTAFDYDLALLTRSGGRGRMANVRKLMRLAAEYEAHEGRDLRGFVTHAEERTRRDDREGQAALQAEEHDGVRVMTVHAAKGLEFPVVAAADLGRRLSAGGRSGDLVIGPLDEGAGDGPEPVAREHVPFGLRLAMPARESLRLWRLVELEGAERSADAEEACRLAYVAATRAQERLILSGAYDPERDLEAAEPAPSDTVLRRLLPVLTDHGWEGGEGEIAMPAAAGIAPRATPAISVSISRPSPERAAELRRRTPPPRPAPSAPERERERPPLLPPVAPPALAGRLSYSALSDFGRCGYRFYVERVIGLGGTPDLGTVGSDREGIPAEPEAGVRGADADELVEPATADAPVRPLERQTSIGNAVHALLEWSARADWREPPEARVEAALGAAGLPGDAEALERARELVAGWLGSELRGELDRATGRVRPELPFALELGGAIVRGKIDLLAELPGEELVVVDYKTDALDGAPSELAERYSIQRSLYALAAATSVSGGTPAGGVRTVYCFLERPGDPVVERHDQGGLAAARGELERLVGRIASGEFERTKEPYPALCYGCPAAARLCGAPAWRPPGPAARAPRQERLFA